MIVTFLTTLPVMLPAQILKYEFPNILILSAVTQFSSLNGVITNFIDSPG